MNNYRSSRFWFGRTAHNIFRGLLVALAAVAVSSITSAQDKKDEVSFDLFIPAGVVDCLRANSYEEPRARATVVHKAGPLAMVSLPDAKTGLGPLCTDPNTSTTPASCNP
jgi:hypothetical protein